RTGRVADQVVDRFLEDQKEIAAHLRTELEVWLPVGGAKTKLDVAAGEDVAREASHAPGQITQAIALRIDRPDNITHRRNRLAREASDGGKRALRWPRIAA